MLHGIEFPGDIQSTFRDECSQRLHLDVKCFLSSGPHAMRLHEADDLVPDSLGMDSPGLMGDALTLRTDDVEQVQLEDHVLLRQS